MELTQLTELIERWDFEAKRAAGRDGKGKLPAPFCESYSAMSERRRWSYSSGRKRTRRQISASRWNSEHPHSRAATLGLAE